MATAKEISNTGPTQNETDDVVAVEIIAWPMSAQAFAGSLISTWDVPRLLNQLTNKGSLTPVST